MTRCASWRRSGPVARRSGERDGGLRPTATISSDPSADSTCSSERTSRQATVARATSFSWAHGRGQFVEALYASPGIWVSLCSDEAVSAPASRSCSQFDWRAALGTGRPSPSRAVERPRFRRCPHRHRRRPATGGARRLHQGGRRPRAIRCHAWELGAWPAAVRRPDRVGTVACRQARGNKRDVRPGLARPRPRGQVVVMEPWS